MKLYLRHKRRNHWKAQAYEKMSRKALTRFWIFWKAFRQDAAKKGQAE